MAPKAHHGWSFQLHDFRRETSDFGVPGTSWYQKNLRSPNVFFSWSICYGFPRDVEVHSSAVWCACSSLILVTGIEKNHADSIKDRWLWVRFEIKDTILPSDLVDDNDYFLSMKQQSLTFASFGNRWVCLRMGYTRFPWNWFSILEVSWDFPRSFGKSHVASPGQTTGWSSVPRARKLRTSKLLEERSDWAILGASFGMVSHISETYPNMEIYGGYAPLTGLQPHLVSGEHSA
jgi:hypothetical protein